MIPVNNYLIITAIGPYRADMVHELTRACTQCGCNLQNVKMGVLGKETALTFFVSGNWGAIAKIEATLPSLEQKLSLNLVARRTTESEKNHKYLSYGIQVAAIDKEGILSGLLEFLLLQGIPLDEISANTYIAQTGTRMASLHVKIHVPEKVHLATFREKFMNYCDDHNLDAFLEPVRNS